MKIKKYQIVVTSPSGRYESVEDQTNSRVLARILLKWHSRQSPYPWKITETA